MFEGYSKCECGAITLYMSNGESYSCYQKNFKKFFTDVDLRKLHKFNNSYCCDHCVNHYGLDLCGCGSGEDFGKCENELEECQYPMQRIGTYTKVIARDAW